MYDLPNAVVSEVTGVKPKKLCLHERKKEPASAFNILAKT